MGLALFFDYTNGFHDAANVVATIITTGALSPRTALTLAAICEFIGPFLFGTAVAQTIGKNIVDISAFDTKVIDLPVFLIIAILIGAISWNLITWFFGIPSSSSHALVGGMVGAVWVAYGPDKIIWGGLIYVVASLILSPFLGLLFGVLFLKVTLHLFRNATPRASLLFNKMQILSSIALALSHGANDAQKSMGLITMSLVLLGISPTFHIPFWVILSCAAAIALGTASGGWRIIKTLGSKIYRLRPVHAFCAQTSSATVILGAALLGRTRFHHSRGLLQHHGGWSRPEDLRRSLGGGQKHHCGLVHYDPGLRDHCRIDLFTLPDLTPQVLMEKGENHGIRF